MPSTTRDTGKITTDLIKLLEERGTGDYIGESISQLEHCLQCANFGTKSGNILPAHIQDSSADRPLSFYPLTSSTGSDEDTVIAALLHDIGQFLPLDAAKDVQMGMGDHSVGRVGHETIGEEYLRGLGFGVKVSRLVGSHVAAKRYLTAVDSTYYDGLSEASKHSLKFQGGPFQGEELASFERDPLKDEMVKLRKWDDQAKIVGIEDETPRANSYRGMIKRHLETAS